MGVRVGLCRIDLVISVRFQFGFLIRKTRIWFGMSLVRFGYYSYFVLVITK